MLRRLLRVALLASVILAGLIPRAAYGAFGLSASTLVADLEGLPIATSEISHYYCHDFDTPLIHCYRTAAGLEAALALSSTELTTTDDAAALSYVRLYDLSGYAGPYISLSADYTDLGVIGWNDRASSYVAVNSETSGLYVNTFYSGSTLLLCCNQHAPSLSSTFDNHISSARRT
jgi:hypothetical protein